MKYVVTDSKPLVTCQSISELILELSHSNVNSVKMNLPIPQTYQSIFELILCKQSHNKCSFKYLKSFFSIIFYYFQMLLVRLFLARIYIRFKTLFWVRFGGSFPLFKRNTGSGYIIFVLASLAWTAWTIFTRFQILCIDDFNVLSLIQKLQLTLFQLSK